MLSAEQRFEAAIEQFDAANADDPNVKVFEGHEYPRALLYGRRMSHWLNVLAPDASESLRLAARSQHLCRWMIPRSRYPMDRGGYFRWRTRLYDFHAARAGEILTQLGYEAAIISRVQSLLRKSDLGSDPEMQTLEDVACLEFLESDFADLSRQYDTEKMINIIQKTWKKMSPRGHEAALKVPMAEADRELVRKALESTP